MLGLLSVQTLGPMTEREAIAMTARNNSNNAATQEPLAEPAEHNREIFLINLRANQKYQEQEDVEAWNKTCSKTIHGQRSQADQHKTWQRKYATRLSEAQAERRRQMVASIARGLRTYEKTGYTINEAGDEIIRRRPYGYGGPWALDDLRAVLEEFGWQPKDARSKGGVK